MDTDAAVIGSGPNGLAAAVALAREGLSVTVYEAADTVGGGARTVEGPAPGLRTDVCSAVHPLSVASPFLASLPLAEHGLRWCWPAVDLAHPLDGGRSVALRRSLEDTCAGLGSDDRRWRRLFEPIVDRFDRLVDDLLGPIVDRPGHPLDLVRFGVRALPPATAYGRYFAEEGAAALLAGIAAHTIRPLSRPATSAVAIVLGAAGHAVGWPVAAGGSQAIVDALASHLTELGGRVETGVEVRSLDDIEPARAVLFDTAPAAAVAIAGRHLPTSVASSLRRFRHGPGSFKLDLAVRGGVPWAAEECRRAGTVHVGGSLDEIADAEAEVAAGRVHDRPFVLVAQQHVADPTRSDGDLHPVWTYTHVPPGWEGDATEHILGQLERFAPGVRDRIEASTARTAVDLERYNANYVGGDIATGANHLRQLVFRPRVTTKPYTLAPGYYLCSAATPPGAGVHGMCGYRAAQAALADLGVQASSGS